MEHENHDQKFVINFALVLAALGGIFFVCILAANMIIPEPEAPPEALARLEERIRPVGRVVTDPAALVKVSTSAAKREPMTADEVLASSCNACHQTGVLESPKVGDTAVWQARSESAGGLEGLTKSAIQGKNAMPPRGGNPDLTDDEIKASIAKMLEMSGV